MNELGIDMTNAMTRKEELVMVKTTEQKLLDEMNDKKSTKIENLETEIEERRNDTDDILV